MSNTDSNIISTLNSSAGKQSVEPYQVGGRARVSADSVEVAAADIDADGDTVKLTRLPGNAVVLSIEVANDDLDSGSDVAFDVGLYTIAGVAKDEDCYGTAVAMQAAAGWTDVTNEARDIDEVGQTVAEDAGDTVADGEAQYDLVLTQTAAAAGAAAGTIAFRVQYVVD